MKRSSVMYNFDLFLPRCVSFFKAHLIAFSAVVAAFAHFVFYGKADTANTKAIVVFCALAVIAFSVLAVKTVGLSKALGTAVAVYFAAVGLITVFFGFQLFYTAVATLVLFGVVTLLLYDNSRLTAESIAFLLFLIGITVRLVYVLYTDCTVRQHDVEQFGSGIGHAGYIEYIYNNLSLPRFDVRTVWQFYHPPLHHIISALFLKLGVFLGGDYSACCESIQTLTFFYSSVAVALCYKLFCELKLKGRSLVAAAAFCALNPIFTVLSGSINNDMLSVVFAISAVLYAIRWYNRRTVRDIVVCALSVGLGMFTKLSVWMVAPAIGIMLITVFVREVKVLKMPFFIKHYGLFALCCVPVGMYWSVRNFILHRVPFSYVPLLGTDSFQYIGGYTATERLFSLPRDFLSNPFMAWGESYYEYNPTVGLIRTALFGEKINDYDFPQIAVSARLLYISAMLVGIVLIIGFTKLFSRKGGIDTMPCTVLLFTAAVTLAMYYFFCFAYPYTCTQNVRYIAALVPVFAVACGVAVKGNGVMKKLFMALIACFCFFGTITFISLAI